MAVATRIMASDCIWDMMNKTKIKMGSGRQDHFT
jgi:hypothetical protein